MKTNVLIIVLLFILCMLMTYPLFFEIKTHIPGFYSTDEPYGPLWHSWLIKHSFENHLLFKQTNFISYPFGVDLYSSGYFAYLWMGIFYLLSILTTPAVTYNIVVFVNLLLSGTFTCALVFYLTKDKLCAIFSGIIFAFCPYQFVRSWQHLTLTLNQWIPLTLLAVVLLKEEYLKKNILIFLLSLLLLFSFDWTIMYLTAMSIITFFVYILFHNWKAKFSGQIKLFKKDFIFLKRVIVIGLFSFILLLPQLLPIIKNRLKLSSTTPASAHNPYHRVFEDLFSQSVKPLSYFLPPVVHPIFGKFTEQFIGSQLYGISFTEHTLYLGWVPLILAFVAFRRWRRKRKEVHKLGTVPFGDSPYQRENFYIGFFVFLAIVAWFFSQPPWWKIGAFKIYMPSFFMYKVLPMFRAYCRFGIVLMLAMAVLAGFGLKFVLERFKTQKSKIAITTLFCGLVLFEFWNYPPFKVIDVSRVPAVYYWLKEQPKDIVIAEYPLDIIGPNEMYKFYQTQHEKKIINGTIPGTYAHNVAESITKLSNSHTTGTLKWMGVKYVLVHSEGYLQTDLIEDREDLDKIPKNKGLKFIRSFPAQECPDEGIMCVQKTGPVDVYEVIARPKEPQIKEGKNESK